MGNIRKIIPGEFGALIIQLAYMILVCVQILCQLLMSSITLTFSAVKQILHTLLRIDPTPLDP